MVRGLKRFAQRDCLVGMKKSVLVIGDTGLIGRYLCKALEADDLYRLYRAHDFSLDVTDYQSILPVIKDTKPDFVINLAALASLDKNRLDEIISINCAGALNVLEALSACGFKGKAIMASSAYVYGNDVSSLLKETSDLDPLNHYACSKVFVENISNLYRNKFDLIITRTFNCIGVGQKREFLIPKLVSFFAKREKVIDVFNTNSVRDFIDVRDVAILYKRLLEKTEYDYYNICSGVGVSIKELIGVLSRITGHYPEIRVNGSRPGNCMQGCVGRLNSLNFVRTYTLQRTLEWMLEEEKSSEGKSEMS